MSHEFGGLWTRKKLEVLSAYLDFYTTALKHQKFTLHYADAFAGTGSFTPPTMDGQALLMPLDDFKGSVRTALEVEPGFHRYHFNDLSRDHAQILRDLQTEYPSRKVQVSNLDANTFVAQFCAGLTTQDRGVLFLDPYSTQLNWRTLEHVRDCEKVDLWMLFPLAATLRMTANDGVMPECRDKLNDLLGANDWEQALYKPVEKPPIADLFGDGSNDTPLQRINHAELQNWVTARLRSLFPYVAEPYLLRAYNRPLFLFYFAVSNRNPAAQALARKVADHIIRQKVGA